MPHLSSNPNAARVMLESNRIGVEFLQTELATGHTFLDIAQVTTVESTRVRTLQNAGLVYETAVHLIRRLDLPPGLEEDLQFRIVELRRRLESLRNKPGTPG